jgi:hypothetical protein
MKSEDGLLSVRLEGEVQMLGRRAVRADPELVAREEIFARPHFMTERAESGRVEGAARVEVADAQMDVVEKAADVELHEASLRQAASERNAYGRVTDS